MGKNLVQQRRGRGTPRYRAPSFNYAGKAEHRKVDNQITQGKIVDIIHCAGHSAPLVKIKYDDGEENLTICPEGVKVGDVVQGGNNAPALLGNMVALKNIPDGTLIFNVENTPGDGGKFARSAGTFAKVVSKSDKGIRVLMPSKKEKDFDPMCRAQVGYVASAGVQDKPLLKAGDRYHAMRSRNKLYPIVCGVSMNAIDHPFGGSSSHHKGRPTIAPKYAPAGKKAGKLSPRRTGKKR